jgi:hypothetical protein
MAIAVEKRICFLLVFVLLALFATLCTARAQPSCFSGPTLKEGYWLEYTAYNGCGGPVTVRFTETEPNGVVTKSLTTVAACRSAQIVQTSKTIAVEFTSYEYDAPTARTICKADSDNSQTPDRKQNVEPSSRIRPKNDANVRPSAVARDDPRRARSCGSFDPANGPVPQRCGEINYACTVECRPADLSQKTEPVAHFGTG